MTDPKTNVKANPKRARLILRGGGLLVSCLLVLTASSFAQSSSGDEAREPAAAAGAPEPQRSEAQAEGTEEKNSVGITNVAIRPSAGAVFFNDTEQFAGGVLLDFNLLSTPMATLGPAFGAIYSNAGRGDFFSGVNTGNEAYIFQIPANLKLTLAPDSGRRFKIGAHGGANLIYSSSAVGGTFGGASPESNLTRTGGGATWDAHGNVGADVDYALTTNVDVTLRPDVTFLADYNMVTATLGLAVKL